MRRGNSKVKGTLVDRLQQIKELVEESIALAQGAPSPVRAPRGERSRPGATATKRDIDFSMPIRPFVKKYAAGMNGPKKFTLVLAHLAGGDPGKKVSLEDVEKQWNKMTAKGLLGVKFNRFYSSKAKDHDWVHTEKSGLYQLRPSWQKIFHAEE